RQLDQHLVPYDAAAGDVAATRLLFPPSDQLSQHRRDARLHVLPALDALIALTRLARGIRDFRFEPGELLAHPVETPMRLQALREMVAHLQEIFHIVDRVRELIAGQRPLTPV